MPGAALAIVAALTSSGPVDICKAFDGIDLAKIGPIWKGSGDGKETFKHAWSAWADRSGARAWTAKAAPSFQLSTTGVGSLAIVATEIRGVRSNDSWKLMLRTSRASRHPHAGKWRSITVTAVASKAIDDALARPCIWSAPRFVPDELPLKAGGFAENFDGPFSMFDVRSGDREFKGTQVSWRLGAPGLFRDAVLSAAKVQTVPPDSSALGSGTRYSKSVYEQ